MACALFASLQVICVRFNAPLTRRDLPGPWQRRTDQWRKLLSINLLLHLLSGFLREVRFSSFLCRLCENVAFWLTAQAARSLPATAMPILPQPFSHVPSTPLRLGSIGVSRPTRHLAPLGRQLIRGRPRPTARRVWEDAASFCSDPLVSCVGWAALISGMTILRVATMDDDRHTPRAFLKRKRQLGSTQAGNSPIVCLGDSITRGNLSADWVSSLRDDWQGLVLNAGVNMQCSQNIQQRIDEVIACKPSHVTVLVGTNDLKAALSPIEGFMYQVFGDLAEVPSLETYEKTLTDIKHRLLQAGAHVALVSPPVLGEDIQSEANQRAAEFAAVVRKVAESNAEGEQCTYLPLFEQTYSACEALPSGRPYSGMNFFAWCCLLCWDMHVLQRDLADIQKERNLGVTVDLVHLGPNAAKDLADMVHGFLRSSQLETARFVPPTAGFEMGMLRR